MIFTKRAVKLYIWVVWKSLFLEIFRIQQENAEKHIQKCTCSDQCGGPETFRKSFLPTYLRDAILLLSVKLIRDEFPVKHPIWIFMQGSQLNLIGKLAVEIKLPKWAKIQTAVPALAFNLIYLT